MFFLPEEHLTQSYECELNEDDLGAFENEIQHAGGDRDLVDVDFMRLVTSLIPNWEEPSSFDTASLLASPPKPRCFALSDLHAQCFDHAKTRVP